MGSVTSDRSSCVQKLRSSSKFNCRPNPSKHPDVLVLAISLSHNPVLEAQSQPRRAYANARLCNFSSGV